VNAIIDLLRSLFERVAEEIVRLWLSVRCDGFHIPSVASCARLQCDLGSGFLPYGVIHGDSQGFEQQNNIN